MKDLTTFRIFILAVQLQKYRINNSLQYELKEITVDDSSDKQHYANIFDGKTAKMAANADATMKLML